MAPGEGREREEKELGKWKRKGNDVGDKCARDYVAGGCVWGVTFYETPRSKSDRGGVEGFQKKK